MYGTNVAAQDNFGTAGDQLIVFDFYNPLSWTNTASSGPVDMGVVGVIRDTAGKPAIRCHGVAVERSPWVDSDCCRPFDQLGGLFN
jgi:hypothetical protein